MSKSISFYITYTLLLIFALTTGFVSSEETAQEIVTRDALSFTIPNPIGDTPLFETNDQNGRLIAMHIP